MEKATSAQENRPMFFFRYQDAICLSNIFTYVLYVQKTKEIKLYPL